MECFLLPFPGDGQIGCWELFAEIRLLKVWKSFTKISFLPHRSFVHKARCVDYWSSLWNRINTVSIVFIQLASLRWACSNCELFQNSKLRRNGQREVRHPDNLTIPLWQYPPLTPVFYSWGLINPMRLCSLSNPFLVAYLYQMASNPDMPSGLQSYKYRLYASKN